MRTRLILGAGLAVVVVAIAAVLVAGGGGDEPRSTPSGMDAQTVSAGEITVRLAPHHVDETGALIQVTLDTHSEELDMDLVRGAELVVGGTPWPVDGWDGDGPSGHHREGNLRFTSAGAAAGAIELTLDGFPSPVAARWQAGR